MLAIIIKLYMTIVLHAYNYINPQYNKLDYPDPNQCEYFIVLGQPAGHKHVLKLVFMLQLTEVLLVI